jgi:hypothetical protein
MQYLKNKFIIISGVVLLILVAFAATKGRGVSPTGIYFGSSFKFSQLFNVHQSPDYWISVNGKKYKGVVGKPPYYLNIPQIGGVFFVTRDANRVAHFCLQSGEHIAIDVSDTYLGLGIGNVSQDTEYDVVYGASKALVLIGSRQGDYMLKYEFDLKEKNYKLLGRFPIMP